GSAKRDAKFVGDEIRRLLESRAVEICPAPRVISPLSIAQAIPLSPDEAGEVDQWLRELRQRSVRSFTDASASGLGVIV
ncbi:hypothetical protein PENTCL1PPCAC_22485, partial [Pristionchus entomophagus]